MQTMNHEHTVPFCSAGHFEQGAVRVTDIIGPFLVMLSLPVLKVFMMLTSTSALPREPGVTDVTFPVSTERK